MRFSSHFQILFFLCGIFSIGNGQIKKENIFQWSAKELWNFSTSHGVVIENESILLNNQQLIEDDSPGCGFDSDTSSNEVLKKDVVLKKILLVDQFPVKEAYIAALFYPENPPNPNNGRHIIFNVNGHDITYEVNHFWTNAKVPGRYLKKGENVITVRTLEPDTRFRTWVALDKNFSKGSLTRLHAPGRSARSKDGGKNWNTEYIGEHENVKGEYSIRLKVIAYEKQGWIETPVIDLAQKNSSEVIHQHADINKLQIKAEFKKTVKTSFVILFQTGTSLTLNDTLWSPWKEYNEEVHKNDIKGRFLKIRLLLQSNNPLSSPLLDSLQINAEVNYYGINPQKEFKIVAYQQYPKVSSSFSFDYENPHNTRVQNLRKKYKLDSIVQGAKTEFEKVLRIKHWVAGLWQWHLLKPNEDIYEWEADKILIPDSNGKIYGGFCLHYAIVLMQSLQSFGLKARIVSADYSIWSGHEICEVWSNEFGKWIMLDANFDTYFIDKISGVPLNTLELHDLFVQACYQNSLINRDDWSREKLVKIAKQYSRNIPVIGMVGGGADNNSLKTYEWWNPIVDQTPYCGGYGPLTMGYIRLLPRANFLSQPDPIPVNHGRTHWGWTGYYNWYDDYTPRAQEHKNFSNRIHDFYWNLNQVGLFVTSKDNGLLTIQCETNCPDFSHYELIVNEVKSAITNNNFTVKSERGLNKIEICTVDSMGNKGMKSYLEYIYLPESEQNSPN